MRVSTGLLAPAMALAVVTTVGAGPANALSVDAFAWEDGFTDNSGLDLTATSGVANQGGSLRANAQVAVVTSKCVRLSAPPGTAFEAWEFAELHLSDLSQVSSARLQIRDCASGAVLLEVSGLPPSCSSVDLQGIDPALHPELRLVLSLEHTTGTPSPGARVERWSVTGRTSGIVSFALEPQSAAAAAGELLGFDVALGADGASLPAATITVDLAAMNADGSLVSDGAVRPLEFGSAAPGFGSGPPSVPAVGASSGQIAWSFASVPSGAFGVLPFQLVVPQGTLSGSTVAARATLRYERVACDGARSWAAEVTADSGNAPVAVSSVTDTQPYMDSDFAAVAPGTDGVRDRVILRDVLASTANPSDRQDITVNLEAVGSTCTPRFRAVEITPADPEVDSWSDFTTLVPGSPITSAVALNFARAAFSGSSPTVGVVFDVPATCTDGQQVVISWTASSPALGLEAQGQVVHQVVASPAACRGARAQLHRSSTGGVDQGGPWPGWPEFYVSSFAPGELLSAWTPWSAETLAFHNVALERSFWLTTLPPYLTFRGVRAVTAAGEASLYKSCDPASPAPGDATFDPIDPTALLGAAGDSGWRPISMVPVAGDPFTLPRTRTSRALSSPLGAGCCRCSATTRHRRTPTPPPGSSRPPCGSATPRTTRWVTASYPLPAAPTWPWPVRPSPTRPPPTRPAASRPAVPARP